MPNTKPPLHLPAQHYKQLLFLLQVLVPHATVLAFGSRVSGNPQALSDIDLAVLNPSNPNKPVEGIERLRGALQESDLPYLVDLHDWATLPESFKETIEQQHLPLQTGRQRH